MRAAPWFGGRLATALMVAAGVACGHGCRDSPVAPTRYGVASVRVHCDAWLAADLRCRAMVSCSPPPCAPGTPDDVTAIAHWMVEDERVARVTGPGRITAVAPGHTVVHAEWSFRLTGFRPISVFPGSAPMPTFQISGSIYEGPTPAAGPIDGAVVEVLDGVIAGRRAVSGAPSDPHPGFVQFATSGYYRVVGVPPGTFRIRVTKEGYHAQEREVTAGILGGPVASFQLQRE